MFCKIFSDRPTDKNIWKWGHSSTPEYLERRNQYRRSEMRYRSKKARKPVQSSKSLDDGFLIKTVDDSLSRSRNISGSVDNLDEQKSKCSHTNEKCNCHSVKKELSGKLKEGSRNDENLEDESFSRPKSTRSKSEPRISSVLITKSQSLNRNDIEIMKPLKKFATLRPTNNDKKEDFEIKVYSKKIMPKRIANLKKKRAKSMKETSTFYTELKITESTDDLTENVVQDQLIENNAINNDDEIIHKNEVNEEEHIDEIENPNKKDSDIISELLKANNKEFEKILNKPPKKKSIDYGRMTSSCESNKSQRELENDLEIKSNDPELFPITAEKFEIILEQKRAITRLNKIQTELNTPEPIYESLKRNVHVPYKYCPSPLLTRSKSQPYPGTPKPKKQERPESDYVTLDFTAALPKYIINEYSQLRNSDSNINYNKGSEKNDSNESIKTTPDYTFERHESFNHKHTKNILNRFMSVRQDESSTKCNSENHLNIKLPQRRVSDVTELCRKSVIYKQGSENLGSRIAHLDYADPKSLFPVATTNNVLINKLSLKPQRDSAFSLTSSSDSVCDSKTPPANISKSEPEYTIKQNDDSFYEDKVEECLENDKFFRDSAVYSDDNNERKHEYNDDRLKITNSLSPPPPPRRPTTHHNPQSPPPLPAKPPRIICCNINQGRNNIVNGQNTPPTPSNDLNNRTTSDRSWVLKQIKNFNK